MAMNMVFRDKDMRIWERYKRPFTAFLFLCFFAINKREIKGKKVKY